MNNPIVLSRCIETKVVQIFASREKVTEISYGGATGGQYILRTPEADVGTNLQDNTVFGAVSILNLNEWISCCAVDSLTRWWFEQALAPILNSLYQKPAEAVNHTLIVKVGSLH